MLMISTNDFQHLGAIKTDLDKLKDWCYSQLPTIADGEIVGFNSKVLHSVSAASADRFVISWRKIKPIYLHSSVVDFVAKRDR